MAGPLEIVPLHPAPAVVNRSLPVLCMLQWVRCILLDLLLHRWAGPIGIRLHFEISSTMQLNNSLVIFIVFLIVFLEPLGLEGFLALISIHWAMLAQFSAHISVLKTQHEWSDVWEGWDSSLHWSRLILVLKHVNRLSSLAFALSMIGSIHYLLQDVLLHCDQMGMIRAEHLSRSHVPDVR